MSGTKQLDPLRAWPGAMRAAAFRHGNTPTTSASAAQAWEEFLSNLHRAGTLALFPDVPPTELDRAEGLRHIAVLRRLGLGEMLYFPDGNQPRFGWSDGLVKWGMDCADALYGQAPLREDGVYRIYGNRGTARFLGFQIVAGMQGITDVDADEFQIRADGSFELYLGGAARAGANWRSLPLGAKAVIVRQFCYDRDNEIPATLEIERVDEPASPPSHA